MLREQGKAQGHFQQPAKSMFSKKHAAKIHLKIHDVVQTT